MTTNVDALYSEDLTVLFSDCSKDSIFYTDQLEQIKEYPETSVILYQFTENIQVTQKVDAEGSVIWEHVTAYTDNKKINATIPLLGKLRSYSLYHSDQTEILAEVEGFELSLFTDHIAVIREYSNEGFFEQEIFMPFEPEENREYLISLFEQVVSYDSKLLKYSKLSSELFTV